MRRITAALLSALFGAAALALAQWCYLSAPVAVQIQVTPLLQPQPLHLQWWCPMPGTVDGVWRTWPAPTAAPEGAEPATIDGEES